VGVAVVGDRLRPHGAGPRVHIKGVETLARGGSLLFRYPTDADPCILMRLPNGRLAAYSQICTHLSCAVVHRPGSRELDCPCHEGHFDCADGRPTSGPPTRRLPRVLLEETSDGVFAVGIEV
jgi:Rieske Fe-S protein